MRVLILDHTGALGGAELALLRLLEALPHTDLHVRVVLFAEGPLRAVLEERGHGVEVLPLDPRLGTADRHDVGRSAMRTARTALAVVPFVLRLGRHIRRRRPDLVHTTSLKADLLGAPAAWIARRPLVWYMHDRIAPDYLPRAVVRFVRILARHAPRAAIVNSRATASTLPGVRSITLAYPGLSPSQIAADPVARTPDQPPVVGILGRVSPTKGQAELVRAAALVHAQRPDVRFRVIGTALFAEAAYEEEVRRMAADLGLGGVVEFPGFTTEPAAALDRLTLCVHASPTPEPFGQVVAEAMARGVPVIATRGGGVDEILEPDGDPAPGGIPLGRLVPPGDVPALAQAILEALADPEDTTRRAAAAWASVQERFTIEATASAVVSAWEQAARGG